MSGIVADMVLTRVDMTPWNVGGRGRNHEDTREEEE